MRLVALAALVACSRSQPPSTSGSGSGSGNDGVPHLGGSAPVDLLTRSKLKALLDVGPGQPFSQELDVFSPSMATITLTHTDGSKGPFTLSIYDAGATVPISSDAMTCAEPGCAIRAEVDVAPGTTKLVVRVESPKPTALTLEVTAVTK